ncbi:TPA: hypothetical protein QB352_000204 [Pasteurella multocida]|nr:hypothetical protein [Pasteurella multocida]
MQHKKYEFKKVSDFFQLTPEEFNRFLDDFKIWFQNGKQIQKLEKNLNERIKQDGVNGSVKMPLPDEIIWIDDNKPGVKAINVTTKEIVNGEIVNKEMFKINIED